MTTSGDSEAYYATDNQFNPIYNLLPELDEILEKVIDKNDLEPFDTLEKRFAAAVLLVSESAELKAWAADELHSLGINSLVFIDANEIKRKIEIEILPHGLGKRFYVNVYATDNHSRKRIFLRAIKYEDETYRRSAFAHFYCPVWLKLIGKSSYLSGKILSFEPDYGVTSNDLSFDLANFKITSKRENVESTQNILIDLLEPFYQVNLLSESTRYKWIIHTDIIDAINAMEVFERDAYFTGKALAQESGTQLETLSEEEQKKYSFYKTVYSDLLMDAASSNIPLEEKILELEVCIRNGVDSIPHQVFKILSKEISENTFDEILSYVVQMDPKDIEYAQDKKFGPPLRRHLLRVLNTFLDEAQSETIMETFDNQIGLTNVSRWVITDRVGEIRYKLKQDLKALIASKAEGAEYIDILSTALAEPYFHYYLASNPLETQKISKLLIEGMGEADYNRFVKPLLEL
ncbi:MAG: hypothetical protein SFY67_12680 [Candidatus Melainabacteria bacterium]|nr:hypothetical protein [Candidatus Melainabacteria bacterium]